MSILLSTLPVLSTIIALLLGARSLHAAWLGTLCALAAILLAFPIPQDSIAPILLRWMPILIEVLLIVGGGLLLADLLREAGAQAALARWISGRAGQGVGAVLLVVHGITPFAESLTGFGIGVTIGIPLLAHFGLPARKVAVIGLLGLCAVPWGSMAPGTLIAATMADLPFQDLGVASAVLSLVPFTVTGMAAAWLTSPRPAALLYGAMSGLVLTLTITAANMVIGTAPAGALGALGMIVLHLWRGRGTGVTLDGIGRRGLGSYGVLLGGLLAASALLRLIALPEDARYLASPALWLFIAALWFSRGMPPRPSLHRAWIAWQQVAPVTGLFIVLGVLMAASGMAAHLARTLAGTGTAYLALAPFVGAMGGFVTGSNSGANAMFATTQAEIARALGVNVLWFMAMHNVAAAFLLMGSPGKIEMALHLSPQGAADHRRWCQRTILSVALIVVALLAGVNLAIGHG